MLKIFQKMSQFFKQNWLLIIFTVLAFATRFFYFSKPAEVVFDEVYFGKFTINYFSGANFFDIHPPLGKILFFIFAKVFGLNYLENQDSQVLLADPKNLFILRIIPTLCGALLIPLVFKFTEALSHSKKAGAIAAFLVLCDNAFLTYSRLALLDIILVFFGILSLWLFFLSLNYQKKGVSCFLDGRIKRKTFKKDFLYFILSALSLGITISIKWTGVAIWGIVLVTLIWKIFKQELNIKKSIFAILTFLIIPSLFYIGSFALHFSLIKKIGPDDAFFSPAYLKNLKDYKESQEVKPLSFFGKFKELNKIMFTSNRDLKATHPYASSWWQWPFSQKSIYLWQRPASTDNTENDGLHRKTTPPAITKTPKDAKTLKTANLWLFGNLFIWLAAFGAMVITFLAIFIKKWRKSFPPIVFWLLFAYFANFLPFIFINRVLFLYHYFFALIFAIITLAILLEKVWTEHPRYRKLICIFFALVLLFFIFFLPLSFGFPEPIWLYNFQLKIVL